MSALPDLRVRLYEPSSSQSTTSSLGKLTAGAHAVIDFWSPRCAKCPAALAALDGTAARMAASTSAASASASVSTGAAATPPTRFFSACVVEDPADLELGEELLDEMGWKALDGHAFLDGAAATTLRQAFGSGGGGGGGFRFPFYVVARQGGRVVHASTTLDHAAIPALLAVAPAPASPLPTPAEAKAKAKAKTGDNVNFHANDFDYHEFAAEAAQSSEAQRPVLPDAERVAALLDRSRAADSWDDFYAREGDPYKPRRYLTIEFPELLAGGPRLAAADAAATSAAAVAVADGEDGEDGKGSSTAGSAPAPFAHGLRSTLARWCGLVHCPLLFDVGSGYGSALFPLLRQNPYLRSFAIDLSKNAIGQMQAHDEYDVHRCCSRAWDITCGLPPGEPARVRPPSSARLRPLAALRPPLCARPPSATNSPPLTSHCAPPPLAPPTHPPTHSPTHPPTHQASAAATPTSRSWSLH